MLEDDDMSVYDAPADEGDGAPRQSHNFAPGYHGVVYRADGYDRGEGAGRGHTRGAVGGNDRNDDGIDNRDDDGIDEDDDDGNDTMNDNDNTTATSTNTNTSTAAATTSQPDADPPKVHYKLQSMKWGLIPSWTAQPSTPSKKQPFNLKTINCRADTLAQRGGLWASMKARKRCVVLAQGFYEWLQPTAGGKIKTPHYVRRKDGRLMCFAGLWDYLPPAKGHRDGGEGEEVQDGDETATVTTATTAEGGLYTYTIITTESCKTLQFLHDRMPVIFEPGGEELWRWLDPARREWSAELQGVLKAYAGELEVYPVSSEVGRVGNDSPSFVIPVASRENKGNIANFFAKAGGKKEGLVKEEKVKEEKVKEEKVKEEKVKEEKVKEEKVKEEKVKEEKVEEEKAVKREELERTVWGGTPGTPTKGVKREADSSPAKGEPPAKKAASVLPAKKMPPARGKISATSNAGRSPVKAKGKADGSQKITKFFGNRS